MNNLYYYETKLSVFQGTFEEILNHIKKIYPDIPTDKSGVLSLNNYKYFDSETSNNYSYITHIQKHLTGDYQLYKGLPYEPIIVDKGIFVRNQIYKIKFNYDDKIITKII